ncbi:hypothetical protein QN383_18650 [Pseudomonas sp. AA4]|uniref:hypothetical protein n=1 Tax=unclassified Pseudomonas TaxID=196821 RepID=UPI002B224A0F|nr:MULTISPECIES: hypothetical protein [unclassified Pseudomonas]MEA9996455.1 hypothetical protein [Pseudomonas sp. AA4]MEB0222243.1 hypothetical protein [Pseudomonas sp. AB12(2023)]
MTSVVRNEVAAKVDKLIIDIIATVRPVPNTTLLNGALVEIGKLLLDPAMQAQAAPVSQMWRLLMGLHIAGSLTEDDLYDLSGQFRDCYLRLYPINED